VRTRCVDRPSNQFAELDVEGILAFAAWTWPGSCPLAERVGASPCARARSASAGDRPKWRSWWTWTAPVGTYW